MRTRTKWALLIQVVGWHLLILAILAIAQDPAPVEQPAPAHWIFGAPELGQDESIVSYEVQVIRAEILDNRMRTLDAVELSKTPGEAIDVIEPYNGADMIMARVRITKQVGNSVVVGWTYWTPPRLAGTLKSGENQ